MDTSTGSDTEIVTSDEEEDVVSVNNTDEEWGADVPLKQFPKPHKVGPNGEVKRYPGRPVKSGDYVGLAAARKKAAKQEEVCLRQIADKEFIELERERRESRAIFTNKIADEVAANGHNPDKIELARRSLLLRQVKDAVATVEKVASSSKKMKSTYVKYLRDAAEAISSASKQLGDLTSSEEINNLERENASLKAENSFLKETISRLQTDVEDIKKELRGMAGKPPSPPILVTPQSSLPSSEDRNEPPPRRYETRGSKGRLSSCGKGTPCPPPTPQTTPLPEDGFGDAMEVVEEVGGLPKSDTTPPINAPPEGTQHQAFQGIMGEVLRQIGDMMNARFAAIESRLLPEETLRPPLQGDKRRRCELPAPPQRDAKGDVPPVPLFSTSGKLRGGAMPPKETEWTTVKGKGKKGKGTTALPPTPSSSNSVGKTALQGPTSKQATTKTTKSYAEAARMERRKEPSTSSKGPPHGKELSLKKSGKPSSGPKASESIPGQPKGKSTPAKMRKPPRRTAAVTLSLLPSPEGQQREKAATIAEALKLAKEKIDLKEIGIEYLRPKRAITGALILEVPGENSSPKADNLAAKLSQIVGVLGVKVARPIKSAELRITKLDDAATCDSVATAIAELGGCAPTDIKVAPPRKSAQGLYAAWVRCPETVAYKAAKTGKVKVGWAQAKVELLKARPLQCYRCLEFGHTRQRCTATTDRGSICYRCSQSGHLAMECTNTPHCALCEGKGLRTAHRMGGNACPLAVPKSKTKKATATPPTRTTRDTRTARDRTAGDSPKTGPTPAPSTEKGKEKGKAVSPTAQLPHPNKKGDAKSPPNKEEGLEEAMDTTQ